MEKPIIACQEKEEEEEQVPDGASQLAVCKKPYLCSSCDAGLAAAGTSRDDAAWGTNSDPDDASPFCIRGYVAAVREINISKCWPFSRQLLKKSIREGKQPLLPPLSPYGCVVCLTSEYYHDVARGSTHEDVNEACAASDGPQLQVQLDLSKFEADLDANECAGTNVPANPSNPSVEAAPLQELEAPCKSLMEETSKLGSHFGEGSNVPANPSNPPVEAAPLQELQAPSKSLMEEMSKLGSHFGEGSNVPANPSNPSVEAAPLQELQAFCKSLMEETPNLGSHFEDGSLVFKRHAPRSIREIRKSVMQGCQCFKWMDAHETCRKDPSSKSWMIPPSPAISNAFDGHLHDGLEYLYQRMIADSENVPGITDLEPKRSTERKSVSGTHDDAIPCTMCKIDGEMGIDVNDTNRLSSMLGASVPTKSVPDVCQNPALSKCMATDMKTKCRSRRWSVSDSQSKDKFCENYNLRPSNSQHCWDSEAQQDLMHTIPCLDNILQQRCPVCLLFQSSSNTALNVHIDRCLAALSMEEGTTKEGKMQKAKVRKKRSIAELCLVAPSGVLVKEHTNNSSTSDCNLKIQKAIRKEALKNKDTFTAKRNENCKQKSKVNTFKVLQWGSRASSRHRATKRDPICEARIPSTKKQSFRDRTLVWRSTPPTKKTNNWKRQKTNHESVAELPHNVQHAPKEKAQKLRKLIQRNKRVPKKENRLVGQLRTEEAHNKLDGKVSFKKKAGTLKVVSLRKNSQKATKGTSCVLTSDAPMTVINSHETIVEFGHTNGRGKAELDKVDKNNKRVQFRVHIQSSSKPKNKCNHKTKTDLQDASDLRLAILRMPPISQEDFNAGHESVRSDSVNPMHTHTGITKGSLEMQMLAQAANLSRTPGSLRRTAEEWSIQEPSLPLLSSMIDNHLGVRESPPNYRNLETCSTQCGHLTCNVHQSNKSEGLPFFKDINNMNVPLLPLGHQPTITASLSNNSAVQFSQQDKMQQIQVRGSQPPQVSHFLPTTLRNNSSISMPQLTRFPFPLSLTEAHLWPGQSERQKLLTAAAVEGVHLPVPPHFFQPLEVPNRISETSSAHQDFTDRHFSVLQNYSEFHQYNPASTQAHFHNDVCSAQNPSFRGGSRDCTSQAQNHSQRLPPWMYTAIQEQRSLASKGISINSTQASNATSTNINPEASRNLSILEMIGNPVIRLMGKTMVLMPDVSQGYDQIDLTTSHLNSQSTYIDFFQSVESEKTYNETQKQSNGIRVYNFHSQPGIEQNYLSGDHTTCRKKDLESLEASRSIPQLQDFFLTTPAVLWANQQTNCQDGAGNTAEQNHPLLQGASQMLAAVSHRAHSNWQHQHNVRGSPPLQPCCPNSKQMRPNIEFSGGDQCDRFRSNITLPPAPYNSMPDVQNNVTNGSCTFPSWLWSPVSRTKTADQPTDIIILDDESPSLSCDASTSGSLQRGAMQHRKLPVVSAAQKSNGLTDCREKVSDSCRTARQTSKDITSMPTMYTVGGNYIQPQTFPGYGGPNVQKSAMAQDCTGVQTFAAALHSRKRLSCFENLQRENSKFLKTSESALLTHNVSSTNHGRASNLDHSESGNHQMSSRKTLCAAVSEEIQSMASIRGLEKLAGSRQPSSPCPEQDGVQGQVATNLREESGLHTPAVGMCSINMNPAEVDCQDAGQFTSTPPIEIISKPIPVHKSWPCTGIQGVRPQPGVPTQELAAGCSDWPLSSSNVSTPNATSHPTRKPSFCITLPTVSKPLCPPLFADRMPKDFFSPASQPGLQGLARSGGMHSLKAGRKFLMSNGRISVIDAQKNQSTSHAQATMATMQNDNRFMNVKVVNVQECMRLNQADKAVKNANGQGHSVPDDRRGQHESIAKSPGNSWAAGTDDSNQGVEAEAASPPDANV